MAFYFTADTHFGHTNILEYCKRPFATIEEHDEALIANINAIVKEGDILYHLGDFAFTHVWSKTADKDRTDTGKTIANYREQINCRNIILIVGNHDPHYKDLSPKPELLEHFSQVHIMQRIRVSFNDERQSIVLAHYAMRTWANSHHGAWHLYGHSHGTLPDDPHARSLDCGVDSHDFKPWTLEQIASIMSKKPWKPIDHHGE